MQFGGPGRELGYVKAPAKPGWMSVEWQVVRDKQSPIDGALLCSTVIDDRAGYDAKSARLDSADLQALRLRTVSTADLLSPALDLALQFDITDYDACYAALAQQLSLPLITADATLINKLSTSPITIQAL